MLRSMIPWRERFPVSFTRFENEMEDLMERYFGNTEEWGVGRFTPSLNVSESDQGYEVTVEVPGLKPEEVKVQVAEGNLEISGDKKEEKDERGKTFHRIERRHGGFRRVVRLPSKVQEDQVEARCENGVLTINIPKSEEIAPKTIEIKA